MEKERRDSRMFGVWGVVLSGNGRGEYGLNLRLCSFGTRFQIFYHSFPSRESLTLTHVSLSLCDFLKSSSVPHINPQFKTSQSCHTTHLHTPSILHHKSPSLHVKPHPLCTFPRTTSLESRSSRISLFLCDVSLYGPHSTRSKQPV